jgi:hypothetical protein
MTVGAFAGAIEAWERAGGTDDLTALVAPAAELVGDLDRSFLAYPRRRSDAKRKEDERCAS